MSTQFEEAAFTFCRAESPLALTGAGISVDCGIPDFRSSGGLWARFSPDEYATLDAFLHNPEKVWVFYRVLGEILVGKEPGGAHVGFARLEREGYLEGVITQNIDRLHQAAGSRQVWEVHGDYESLHCIQCDYSEKTSDSVLVGGWVPLCKRCEFPLKPNVVLFGEMVRQLEAIKTRIQDCDLLLVAGTSATVFPVSEIPFTVSSNGGTVIEFNLAPTRITSIADHVFQGRIDEMVPSFVGAVLNKAP